MPWHDTDTDREVVRELGAIASRLRAMLALVGAASPRGVLIARELAQVGRLQRLFCSFRREACHPAAGPECTSDAVGGLVTESPETRIMREAYRWGE